VAGGYPGCYPGMVCAPASTSQRQGLYRLGAPGGWMGMARGGVEGVKSLFVRFCPISGGLCPDLSVFVRRGGAGVY